MGAKRPGRELLTRAIAAVRASDYGGPLHVDDAHCVVAADGVLVYLDDVPYADLTTGAVYTTFVVRFKRDAVDLVSVSTYRTEVGPDGRHTTLETRAVKI